MSEPARLSLVPPVETLHRKNDPETSIKAAKKVRAGYQNAKVLDTYMDLWRGGTPRPVSNYEASRLTCGNMTWHHRTSDLHKLGLVEIVGEGKNPNGNDANLYAITALGRRVWYALYVDGQPYVMVEL